jgi:multiple sugar transport system permease protein
MTNKTKAGGGEAGEGAGSAGASPGDGEVRAVAVAANPVRVGTRRKGRSHRLLGRASLYVALLIAVLYTAYPIVAAAGDALGFNFAALWAGNKIVLIGDIPFVNGFFSFVPAYFEDALTLSAFPARVLNSLMIGGLSVGAALLVGVPVSYMLARIEIRGRGAVSFILLALRTVSPFAVVIPLYIVFTRIGLWDTYQGVALAELLLILTVVVWMVKGFFQDIPRQVYDSASVFGASEGQIFWKVALPIVFTGIAITALFGFILVWNEYLIAVVMTGPATKPVSVGVFSGLGATNKTPDFTDLEAAATLAFLPAAAVLLAIRRYLAKGFSLAAAN